MHGGGTFLRSPIPQRTQEEAGQPHTPTLTQPALWKARMESVCCKADGALLISPSAEQQLKLLRLEQRFLVG